jgi:hypothetical protein
MSRIGSMVRQPAELVPLIRRELAQGAAHYRAAGQLLLEAKSSMPHGTFKRWVREHCGVSYTQASRYMRLAAKGSTHGTFRDLEADPTTRRQVHPKRRDEAEIDRMREEAHALIAAGFRARAIKLHPDHAGGSVEAMARLNKVREGLVRQVGRWLGGM